jgi:hypothetical protein
MCNYVKIFFEYSCYYSKNNYIVQMYILNNMDTNINIINHKLKKYLIKMKNNKCTKYSQKYKYYVDQIG